MRKISKAFLIVLLCFTLLLSGCITVERNFEIDESSVSSIEIYDLREYNESTWDFYKHVDPDYTLKKELHGEFLDDLGKIEFTDTKVLLPIPMDPSFEYGSWTVRINYTNGDYRFISHAGYGETYNEDGSIVDSDHYGCNYEEWIGLIEKYLPEHIFDTTESHVDKVADL